MKKLSIYFALITAMLIFNANEAFSFEKSAMPDFNFVNSIFDLNSNNVQHFADARRGGGGRRGGSIGGSRRSRSTSRSKSSTSKPRTNPKKTPSFGGNRMSKAQATKKYGTPRKTETMTGKNAAGETVNYNVNRYGGYGSGLMTGYMMGATPFMWSMPFHPAFYYSRPNYVTNPNGSIDVYPPRFSFGKLLITLIIIAAIIFIIRRIIKSRKAGNTSQSSFG